jgi:hypothetical protein
MLAHALKAVLSKEVKVQPFHKNRFLVVRGIMLEKKRGLRFGGSEVY